MNIVRKKSVTIFLAENVGFEPTVPFGITGFQDQPLKPLGQLSETVLDYITTEPNPCQALFLQKHYFSFRKKRYTACAAAAFMESTAASSSSLALLIASLDPNAFISARRLVGPIPSISSRTE